MTATWYNTFLEIKRGGSILLKGRAIATLYKEVFNEEMKLNCGRCITDGFKRLEKFFMKKEKPKNKYIFSEKYAGKTINVNIAGMMVKVTSETLTDITAQAIMNNPRMKRDIVILNPEYDGVIEVEKKSGAESVTLSISSPALNVGSISVENVKEKESNVSELKQSEVTVKKRGRPFKKTQEKESSQTE